MSKLEEKFWNRVKKTDSCWLWQGAKNTQGYGNITVAGKFLKAHRLAWELVKGEIPNGMCVCHHCDNPSCVNPEHLFLGTKLDNARDMVSKGRQQRGEKSGRVKLTNSQVQEIRGKYATGSYTHRQLAKEYGVWFTVIGEIIRGEIWKHIN